MAHPPPKGHQDSAGIGPVFDPVPLYAQQEAQAPAESGAGPHTNYDTPLPPQAQAAFTKWKAQVAPNDSGADYDLRGAFLAGVQPDPATGHFPDTFKKPNHPTFSDQSQYAKFAPGKAGKWNGDVYQASESFKVDPTSPIIDRTNGRRVRVNETDLHELVKNGIVGYAPEHQINVIAPNGQAFTVPGDSLRYALTQGYHIETHKQVAVREYVQEHKGLSDAAKVALGQMADEALFGIPEMVFDKLGDEYDVAKKDGLKQEHDIANALGGAAGFAASLIYGGEATGATKAGAAVERAIVKAPQVDALAARLASTGIKDAAPIAAGLARKVAAKAAATGVEGAMFQAPQAITEAALGDPEKAAEHLLESFGAGAALGAIGRLGSSALEAAGPRLGALAEEQAFRSLNASRNLKVAKMADEIEGGVKGIGRTVLDENLTRARGEDFGELADRISNRRTEVGEGIGNLYGQLDGVGSSIKLSTTDQLAARFQQTVVKPLASIPGNEGLVAKVGGYIDSFASKGEGRSLTFQELHTWRQGLDDLIWREGQIGITDKAGKQLAKIRGMITDELETKGQQVAESIGGEFKATLGEQNILYRRLKVAEEAASHSASTEMSNRVFSPSDYGVGIAMGAGAMAHGNPLPLLKSTIGSYAHKLVRENGNGIIARALDGLGFSSKGNSLLRYGLDNGGSKQVGLLMAEKAVKDGGTQLDRIPGMLGSMSVGNAVRQAVVRGAPRLGDALMAQATQVMQNREQLETNVETLSSVIRDQGAPNIGRAYADKQRVASQYILDSMPNQPAPDPFKPNVPKVKDAELSKFSRKLEVVNDPYVIMQHLQDGTLTVEHIEAMQKVWPKILDEMLSRIDRHAYSGQMAPLSSTGRRGVERLRGTPAYKINYNTLFSDKRPAQQAQPKLGAKSLSSQPLMASDDFSRVVSKGVGRK